MACSILAHSPAVAQEPEPQIPTIESILDQEQSNSAKQEFSDEEYLALTMWGEARGLNAVHMSYVGSVILNRTKSRKYPKTIREVVLQPNQFMVWNIRNKNYRKMLAVRRGAMSQDAEIYRQALVIARKLLKDGPIIRALSFQSRNGKHVYF